MNSHLSPNCIHATPERIIDHDHVSLQNIYCYQESTNMGFIGADYQKSSRQKTDILD